MTILLSIIAFLVIFSVLVLVHELGHFWAAKKAGICVEEFGFGLPPRIWGKETSHQITYKDKDGKTKHKKEKMIWSLNWIPFGGFVKMLGEDDDSKEAKTNPRSFANRPIGWRILVVVAGVCMNFLLGWFLLTVAFSVGSEPLLVTASDVQKGIDNGSIITSDGVVINENTGESALKESDIIIKVNNENVKNFDDLGKIIKDKEGNLSLTIKSYDENNEELISTVEINKDTLKQDISFSTVPVIEEIKKMKLSPPAAFLYAGKESVRISVLSVEVFGSVIKKIATTFSPPEGVAGPVGIARFTYNFVKLGEMMKLVVFMAMISLSLAVINIMPLPALDGGRLLFLIVELFTGKKPSPKWEASIHGAGLILLLSLIALITWSDITNWINSYL